MDKIILLRVLGIALSSLWMILFFLSLYHALKSRKAAREAQRLAAEAQRNAAELDAMRGKKS